MLDLVFVAALTIWSAAVGLRILRRFGPLPETFSDTFALAVPIGLGVLGLTVLGLGEVGRLDRGHILAVLGVGVGAVVSIPGLASQTPRASAGTRRVEWPDVVIGFLVAAALVGTLLTSLVPVTDGDALCYHLQVPKIFLERGAVGFDPDLHETVYPLLTEMIYAVALALRGPVACRLIQWLFGIVFVLNVNALARPTLGPRAWWAGAIALLVPAVNNGMTAPLNDVALAAYGAAALFAWSRFQDRPGLRTAALAGVLVGLAMGVKYPALVLAGLLGLMTVGRLALGMSPGIARRFLPLGAFIAAAWLVGGCWYVRAYAHTGNPVHPFFRQTFGGAGLDEVLGPEKRPLPVDPVHLLTALGPMTLEPDRFDSFSHQFGPVFLLFLPATLWGRPPRRLVTIAGLGYAFLLICVTQRQSMRFVLTAVGPLSVAVAWQTQSWWARNSTVGRTLVAAVLIALAFESTLAVARVRHGLGVVLGRETAEDYLARREPTYCVGNWVGQHLAGSARLVGQDHRGYYIPRPYTMELAHRRRTGLIRPADSPETIVGRLRSAGFTHLLLCPPVPETAVEFDPALGDALAPWLVGRIPVYRNDLTDADGVLRRYAIYPLVGPQFAVDGAASGVSLR